MSTVCPEGHTSTDPDYCDHCGARMNPPDPAPVPDTAAPEQEVNAPVAAPIDPPVAVDECPRCHAPRFEADVRFCEACGYDFNSATATWEAVVMADRMHFARNAPETASFPEDATDRIFVLNAERVAIGRARATGDAAPEIDLSERPEDTAVSHAHAVLERQPDGGYSIVDRGSTNGTTINDDPNPIAQNVPVALGDGDEIHIGMWTTILIRRADAA